MSVMAVGMVQSSAVSALVVVVMRTMGELKKRNM